MAETLPDPEDALAAPEAAAPGTGTGAGPKDAPPAGAEAPPAAAAFKAAAAIASGVFPGAVANITGTEATAAETVVVLRAVAVATAVDTTGGADPHDDAEVTLGVVSIASFP